MTFAPADAERQRVPLGPGRDTDAGGPAAELPARPARRRHLPGLDGLRGVAVLLVLVYHAMPGRLPGGFVGVDVFFVLSGFLITALLLHERTTNGRVRLGSFWIRRIRRLAPAVVVMLLVTAASTLLVGHDTGAGLRGQVLGALTWTSNWVQIHQGWSYSDAHLPPLLNHLWSLGIEEQFYLLWPLVLLAALMVVKRFGTFLLTIGLALASVVVMMLWFLDIGANRAYMGLDSHAFGLLFGAALALSSVPHELADGASLPRSLAWRNLAGVLGLALVAAFAVLVHWDSDANFLGGLALANLATVGLILAAVSPTAVARALAVKPLRWIGERSYGLYLWHWPLMVFAVRLGPPDQAEAWSCVAAVVAVAIAAASYRHVEVPMRRDGVRATLRRWATALRDERRGARRRSLIVTVGILTIVLAGAALCQAPAESEVSSTLRAGQEVVVGSVDDMDPAPTGSVSSPSQQQEEDEGDAALGPASGCVAVPPPAPVSAFGDSVTVAIAPALMERRPGTAAVAAVGWQYQDVAGAVREVAAAGRLEQAVLIATGTNGAIDAADLDALVTHELAGVQVALVVPSVPGHYWAEQAAEAVRTVAAAHDHVHLVDWDSVAGQQADLTTADRVHPSAHGQGVFVDLVGGALAQC